MEMVKTQEQDLTVVTPLSNIKRRKLLAIDSGFVIPAVVQDGGDDQTSQEGSKLMSRCQIKYHHH